MKTRSVLFMICVMLLIPSTTMPTPAVRCFMLLYNSLQERVDHELKGATVIFSGKVIAKEFRPVRNPAEHPVGSQEGVIKLSVERWWKGDGKEEVIMYTSEIKQPDGFVWSYAEDFRFEVGKAYLVYAFGEPNGLLTDQCSLTRPLEQAADQLQILGEGKKPGK